MTAQYAVIGNPIAHSKSPDIHSQFAAQTQQDMVYTKLLAEVDDFDNAVNTFRNNQGMGLNITVPFKLDAWRFADELNDLAKRAEAVNTLIFQDNGKVLGANTDGVGIFRDLTENNHVTIADKTILILGAGGAVRGVLQPLLEANPKALFIANRTAEKAEALAQDFSDLGTISGGGFDTIGDQTFDLIINGTAAGLQGEVPPIPDTCLKAQGDCYDMMYSATEDTAFVKWAKQHDANKALDGLGMLVEQAAESFYLWRGVRPETKPVLESLRQGA